MISLREAIIKILTPGPSHGYEIARKIEELDEEVDMSEGTLYPTLHAMEHEGLLKSYRGMVEGRPRHYYRLNGIRGTNENEQRDRRLGKLVPELEN